MQARRNLKATAAIAAGFALAFPGLSATGGGFHGGAFHGGGGFHHGGAPTFAAGSITARPFIFGGFRTPRLPSPGPNPGFGGVPDGHGPHGMRPGGHGREGHDQGFPGWGSGWGWDGAYDAAEPQVEEASEAPTPRVAAEPICPALFEWSPKLGRAVRHDLCKERDGA